MIADTKRLCLVFILRQVILQDTYDRIRISADRVYEPKDELRKLNIIHHLVDARFLREGERYNTDQIATVAAKKQFGFRNKNQSVRP